MKKNIVFVLIFLSSLFVLTAQSSALPHKTLLEKTPSFKLLNASSKNRLKGLPAIKQANKKATQEPQSSHYINSIMIFDYLPGALYEIYCAPLYVTDVEFEVGESIVSVGAGDTLRWQVSKTYSGDDVNRKEHLLIKPIDTDISNSMVITTNLRTYHLELRSTNTTYMAMIKWRYPEENSFVQHFQKDQSQKMAQPAPGVDLTNMDFNYKAKIIHGSTPSWIPEMVFNDGNKTYVQFPKNMQVAPALFINDPLTQQVEIINYHVNENYYIIDRVVKHLELRVGQTSPTVIDINYTGDN